MELLDSFARDFRLKIGLDECGEPIIHGRRGYFYQDAGCIGIVYQGTPRNKVTRRLLGLSGISRVIAEGDDEVILLADPAIYDMNFAISAIGVRRRKGVSPQHVAKLRAGLRKEWPSPPSTGYL